MLRYVTPAIGGCETGPLEGFRNLCLKGKYPGELYDDFTKSLAV